MVLDGSLGMELGNPYPPAHEFLIVDCLAWVTVCGCWLFHVLYCALLRELNNMFAALSHESVWFPSKVSPLR